MNLSEEDLALLRKGQKHWTEEVRLKAQTRLRILEAAGLVKTELRPIQPGSDGTASLTQFLWRLTTDAGQKANSE